jgi:hypothetical protein
MWRFPIALAVLIVSGSPLRADEPFDYFTNSWSMVGLNDYLAATRITPQNELLLAEKQRLRIAIGPQSTPLSRRQVKTRMEGWLPVIQFTAVQDSVRYAFQIWAAPLPDVKDWAAAYDGPGQGENYLNWIRVQVSNAGSQARHASLVAERAGSTLAPTRWECELQPGQQEQIVLRVPYTITAETYADADSQVWLDRTVDYWHKLIGSGAKFDVPDSKVRDALLASHVDQFINNDHGVVHGGEGFYDEFYLRDGAYQVLQFEEGGFTATARRSLDAYLAAQRQDGRFETQPGQFDANGQAVWTLWQYYLITDDRDWLERAYPAMRKAVAWTATARKTAPADSAFAGLLPNALADGENLWNGKYHIVGYDFWNLRALLCTLAAARELQRQADADELSKETQSYREAIEAAWKKTGLPHFPPSWEKEGTHWGNTETLWPTPLFAPDDARVGALIREVRRNFGGGFHEGTIRWTPAMRPPAIHPYMSSYTTMASLISGDGESVVQDFYWYLLHSTAAHAFPEGILYEQRFAWSDTIPHATGASNYCFLLRHMLLHEQGDELHILPAVPDWWLEDGRSISVEQAPTHFGEVSFSLKGGEKTVEMKWTAPRRKTPRRTVLHLPESLQLAHQPDGIEVASRAKQTRRWDYPSVIAEYDKIRPQEVDGVLAFPLDDSPVAEKCAVLDLAALANTDPFTAPFGVANPGNFLFTGLKPGQQTALQVPFRILDPAANGGRALLVLQGGEAGGRAAKFPTEVSIPVNQQGKRLFFLGNVAGWTSRDDSAKAIAEYVIVYADGQRQTVPWILGKTADEWAQAPYATQAFVAWQGEPWHLNVCGIALRPVPVKEILFRDLGTAAAPVLAAVTLEK